MVAVIFIMRKTITENKNNLLLFFMKSGFVSKVGCWLSKDLSGLMEERKNDSWLRRVATCSARSGNLKVKENSSDFVIL